MSCPKESVSLRVDCDTRELVVVCVFRDLLMRELSTGASTIYAMLLAGRRPVVSLGDDAVV